MNCGRASRKNKRPCQTDRGEKYTVSVVPPWFPENTGHSEPLTQAYADLYLVSRPELQSELHITADRHSHRPRPLFGRLIRLLSFSTLFHIQLFITQIMKKINSLRIIFDKNPNLPRQTAERRFDAALPAAKTEKCLFYVAICVGHARNKLAIIYFSTGF